MAAGGVQVDAVRALADDLRHEQVRQTAGERPARRAGKAAVQIAPIGQVAIAVDEAKDVDDGDRDDAAGR